MTRKQRDKLKAQYELLKKSFAELENDPEYIALCNEAKIEDLTQRIEALEAVCEKHRIVHEMNAGYTLVIDGLRKNVEKLLADVYPPHDHPDRHNTQTPKPKYEVGQWYARNSKPLPRGMAMQKLPIWQWTKEMSEDQMEPYFRPAVPSDFDVQVGNLTVRAYEHGDVGNVKLMWSDGCEVLVSADVAAAYGYPVCPLSVSGGVYSSPKGEK